MTVPKKQLEAGVQASLDKADAALQPGDVRRVVAEVEMASDVSYNLAATTAIAPLTVSFTAVAGTHVVNLHLFNSQTVAVGLRRLYFRVDGGAWVMFGWDGKYSGQGTNTVCSRLVVLGAGAAQIDVAIAVVAGTVNVLGSTEVPSRLFIEGP